VKLNGRGKSVVFFDLDYRFAMGRFDVLLQETIGRAIKAHPEKGVEVERCFSTIIIFRSEIIFFGFF
jgi:hypothetical protein